jgi:hypothetical protein
MTSYSYHEVEALVRMEIAEQMRKANAKSDEVLSIPVIMGPVGVGKTSLIRGVADEYGLELLNINCGENGDPTDVTGMAVPWASKKDTEGDAYMQYLLNEMLHSACKKPVMLFFDDIDKMPTIVEGALVGLFGKREARGKKLHPETLIVGAGNRTVDDRLAHELSESLKTRATIIEINYTLDDFREFAQNNAGLIPVEVMGYLNYRPQHLHQQQDNVMRFPTPRSWVEASQILKKYGPRDPFPSPRHSAWETIIGMKCGDHIGKDFWAWYTIVAAVDMEKILYQGRIETRGALKDQTELTMIQYAAVFAVAQELNNNTKGISPKYTGLETFCRGLDPEMRVALFTQLAQPTKLALRNHLKSVADVLMQDIVYANAV